MTKVYRFIFFTSYRVPLREDTICDRATMLGFSDKLVSRPYLLQTLTPLLSSPKATPKHTQRRKGVLFPWSLCCLLFVKISERYNI